MKGIQYVEYGNTKDGPDKQWDEYRKSKGGLLKSTNRDVLQEDMNI